MSKSSTVFVGLSGGVDSSVAAHLLKEKGYTVVGVFIRTWHPDWLPCTWRQERRSAMRVAAVLDIPLLTLDLEKEYKEGVAEYLIEEYRNGRTPNPDVMCNRVIKFGAFLKWAREEGADYIATGHYARQESGLLKKGIDEKKDQSYFLWTLSREILEHVLFPIGHLEKGAVRDIAANAGLPTATKKDSQGICFLGDVNMKEFLSRYVDPKEGEVLNEQGEIIGTHNGALLYTLGQRHGFTITKKTVDTPVYYVVDKEMERNTITVASSIPAAYSSKVHLSDVVWNQGSAPIGKKLTCRGRYRQALVSCEVLNETTVKIDETDEPLTPGQSLVIYDGDVCLGGGVISGLV